MRSSRCCSSAAEASNWRHPYPHAFEEIQISADWAAQRIKDLSLWSALRNAIFPGGGDRAVATTLIDTFHYPRRGPEMMWERAGREIESRGGGIEMGRRAVRLRRLDRGGWEVASRTA